ncbi:MAG: ATP-dependent zinc protease [Anderseniella sp.]|nr:ATP-dependent zinc protease [Anderseniella sp.]
MASSATDTVAQAVTETRHQPAGQIGKTKVIGWREQIILPEFGSTHLDAKIDTGARTSALHAVDLAAEIRNGEEWVSFHVPYLGEQRSVRHSAKIFDRRKIRNTSGIAQVRYVIKTTLVLGVRQWQIEVSLADREKMKHDIILGRTAVRDQGLLVDPAKSYLAGAPVSDAPGKPPWRP